MTTVTPLPEHSVVTVTLPSLHARSTLAQRLCLHLALWLLLRSTRPAGRTRDHSRRRRAEASDHGAALSREAGATLTQLSALRPQR